MDLEHVYMDEACEIDVKMAITPKSYFCPKMRFFYKTKWPKKHISPNLVILHHAQL